MIADLLMSWFEVNVSHEAVLAALLAIGFSLLLPQLISVSLLKYLEKTISKIEAPDKVELRPDWFSIIVKHALTLLLLWLFYIVLKFNSIPAEILRPVFYFFFVLLIYRFSSWYIKSTFWSRFVFVTCLLFIILSAIGSWAVTLHILDSMTIKLGHVHISLLGITRTLITFLFLWPVAFMMNHYLSFLMIATTRLSYSDMRHLERVIKLMLIAIVALITLAAAGISPAALTVFGGAAGFALGIGLQKIGSNVVSGIALMLRKPVNQGDVLLLQEGTANILKSVVVKEIGLIYIHVYTRDGTIELIPNEFFVTQKIVNASLPIKPLRLRIPFGISYKSDLQKAMALSIEAGKSVERILADPEPACLLREFGESTVNFELRLWISDPENGLNNVKSLVLLAVWDIFHGNNIEFAFPQRDLHFKNSLPFVKD